MNKSGYISYETEMGIYINSLRHLIYICKLGIIQITVNEELCQVMEKHRTFVKPKFCLREKLNKKMLSKYILMYKINGLNPDIKFSFFKR